MVKGDKDMDMEESPESVEILMMGMINKKFVTFTAGGIFMCANR